MPPSSPLKRALKDESVLQERTFKGMKSLGKDSAHVHPKPPQIVEDSLNFDEATAAAHPHDHRWDYFLGVSEDRLVAVEVHPSSDSEVDTVIAKRKRTLEILGEHLKPGHSIGWWFWVSSGRTAITAGSRHAKRLAKAGIKHLGSPLRLPKEIEK